MKIGVISDTHVSNGIGKLPAALYEGLAGVDMILHAGDIVSMDVIHELAAIAPVEAVAGNMDDWNVASRLPEKKLVKAGKFTIGITHGAGKVTTIEERVLSVFAGDDVDCIVYGHSHNPSVTRHGKVLLVNPGSPTDKRWARINSYAIITVDDELTVEIISL